MILLLFLLGYSQADGDNACYAAPNVFGPDCLSGENWLPGDDSMTITYHIDATSDATKLFCEALGAGQEAAAGEDQQCSFGWYAIEDGDELMWGPNDASPGVRCKGVPSGSAFTWSYEHSNSDSNSCPPPFTNDGFARDKNVAAVFDTPTILFLVFGAIVVFTVCLAAVFFFVSSKKYAYQTLP